MKDIAAKSQYDGVTNPVPTDESHASSEYEDRRVEIQGAITDSSQTLAEADVGQLSKAMFANGVAAQSMVDSGVAGAIIITPITGPNGLRVAIPIAKDYSLLDGAIFSFKAAATNAGNTTVNVGRTTGGGLIGQVPLFLEDGTTQVGAGIIVANNYYSIRFDSALDGGGGAFVIIEGRIVYDYLVMQNTADQLSGSTAFTKVDLGSVVKQRGITETSSVISLFANRLYRISYNLEAAYVSGTDPTIRARLNVVSGDVSWDLELVSLQLQEINSTSEQTSLSGTFIIVPNVATTIQLQAFTTQTTQVGKVVAVSMSVWSE